MLHNWFDLPQIQYFLVQMINRMNSFVKLKLAINFGSTEDFVLSEKYVQENFKNYNDDP